MAAKYLLKLYITGETVNSQKAIKNLKDILNKELMGIYTLKVIDVLKHPQLAEGVYGLPVQGETLALQAR